MWNGYDVRYTCAGLHNDGPAVVCVHGFGGNADHWRKNTGPLAACGFRVFSIDLLGYGYSSKPAPVEETPNSVYNFETWAAQLKDFCACVAGGPAFLVTNSVGGVAALQCAVSFPECVRGVVLMNVSLRGLHTSKQLPFMRPLITAFQRTLRTSNLGKSFFASVAQPQTVKNILREAYCDKSAVTDELVDAILKPGMQPGAAAVFLDFISYSTGPLAEELLPKVSAPVLTLWGQRDPWEDVRLARGLYTPEAVPGVVTAFVELPGVGHCPQDEAPHLVNPLVADFIRKHS
jgi:pimeloyl-ACP methyl ester carboxylesterase